MINLKKWFRKDSALVRVLLNIAVWIVPFWIIAIAVARLCGSHFGLGWGWQILIGFIVLNVLTCCLIRNSVLRHMPLRIQYIFWLNWKHAAGKRIKDPLFAYPMAIFLELSADNIFWKDGLDAA